MKSNKKTANNIFVDVIDDKVSLEYLFCLSTLVRFRIQLSSIRISVYLLLLQSTCHEYDKPG